MKRIKLLTTLLILFAILLISPKINAKDYITPTKQLIEYTDSTTIDTYTIKNKKYNVYKSKNGAFYIWKISKKTGKRYKYYLPKEIQIQMGRKYE